MKYLSLVLLLLAGQAPATEPAWRQAQPGTMQRVLTPIVAQGYATGATTNQARFVADFLFALAARPELDGQAFHIDPAQFFTVWTTVTGTAPDQAPIAIANVLEYDQHFHVRPVGVERMRPPPRRALAVRVEWPEDDDRPQSYEYRDRLSDPEVRMRHERRIEYLLLDYGDFAAFENIEGISGRPVTGALGALFRLLGMTRIESTRLAVAEDGTQITRARVRKFLFRFTAVAAIDAQGNAERNLPDDREDLKRLAERLELEIDIAPDPG